MKNYTGFTLIELMIVIAIMGIIATYVLPNYTSRLISTQVQEGLKFGEYYQQEVADYYKINGRFPQNNAALNIPAPDEILGNYVVGVTIDSGAINVEFGNYINKLAANKVLSIRPLVVKGSSRSPIDWVCGNRKAPQGMKAVGENKTTLIVQMMPLQCR